ncbi:seryl-tRNA synthetase [Chloroherpeton thalassium ATCC 35110]|uniref:Serine--tRNA ligase n=1 Tax=Chloroherpeton thalassium (strain ATCC 35110 / GB-78) TaxID=517418 RepID=SYS_CHLT3|nr:serine--tRNA ligase [Chloroherpeton thalassium]B3QV79.1 RecName: Full=Serine--tRNA ligase; AltName: Full=Seryl-tRNA synthetase; Short=SerRS; AltName: Full=Seryl-tRNA(Ser/Sec) synthetase [Chloroherpeton thalassium ATCC 35110]ACF13033.1 seryl-tRNA synthetase [Chloroherpeton thalassium ATCC 35110]
MLDIKYVRENPDAVKKMLEMRLLASESKKIDELIRYDSERKAKVTESDTLKAMRNSVTQEIAKIKREKTGSADELIAEMKIVSDRISEIDAELREIETKQEELLLAVPNILHESVPEGKSAADNVVYKEVMDCKREFDFKPKDHIELGKSLGMLDFERGAKIAGAGFPLYIGKGASLERALINFMLDLHLEKHGYKEVFPPFFVNRDSLRGTGQWPKFADQVYYMNDDDIYAIPTAEVPVTNMHRDEMLQSKELPIKYAAYSACFRREAGSYGKDTKGFLRVHQFNKVEMVKFVLPETSYDELEALLGDAEDVLKALEIPYRVLLLCSGDISANAAKCYDIEVWSPAEEKFLEASSCSNFEDYQARRAQIRFRRQPKAKPEFVHTLNGSGLATSRLMVSLMENYQTPDGKIQVPKVLQKYMGCEVIG